MNNEKTPPIVKSISDSRFSQASTSTNTISSVDDASVDDNGFHLSKLLQDYRKCMKKVEKGEVTEYQCSYIARHTTERNPKSIQDDEWTKKHLQDAGHGRYNGK